MPVIGDKNRSRMKAGGSMNDVCSPIIGKEGLASLHFFL
jgi:hypothetical protein